MMNRKSKNCTAPKKKNKSIFSPVLIATCNHTLLNKFHEGAKQGKAVTGGGTNRWLAGCTIFPFVEH